MQLITLLGLFIDGLSSATTHDSSSTSIIGMCGMNTLADLQESHMHQTQHAASSRVSKPQRSQGRAHKVRVANNQISFTISRSADQRRHRDTCLARPMRKAWVRRSSTRRHCSPCRHIAICVCKHDNDQAADYSGSHKKRRSLPLTFPPRVSHHPTLARSRGTGTGIVFLLAA